MKIEDEITVMATYKPLLHILTIYDWKNFQHQDRRTVFSNLLQAIAVSASAFGYFICLLCDAWYCIEHSFNVTKVAMQMALFISALQLAIAYITIRINNERVNDAISAINRIVTERKCGLNNNFQFEAPSVSPPSVPTLLIKFTLSLKLYSRM